MEADPGLNYVMPIFDPETEYVTPALLSAHKIGIVHVATYAGTPFVLQDIREGSVQMDVGENLQWVGYAMLDDEMRLIGHLKPAFPEYLATRVFTKSDIGTSSSASAEYGTSVGQAWLKLWGL
jgi:ribose transport system substrate-binding protein